MTERTERKDFVKRSFDVFFDYYSQEPHHSRIDAMGKLGIDSTVLNVVLNPETYVYTPTDSAESVFDDTSNSIAVVALAPGEEITLPVSFHPLQASKELGRSIDVPNTFQATIDNTSGARLYTPTFLHSFNETTDKHLVARPTLVLPYDRSKEHEYSTVLVHELTHVAQSLMSSVKAVEKSEQGALDVLATAYNNELDAYQMQEDVFGVDSDDVINFLFDETASTAVTVKSYRNRHLRSTQGYVTRSNLDHIRHADIVGGIVRRGLIKNS